MHRLIDNIAYNKKRKRSDGKPSNNKKDYFQWASKPSYMSHEIFDNGLVAIHKIKVTLKVNKQAHVGMCILSKVLMSEFQYGYIENRYCLNSRLLFNVTNTLNYGIDIDV